MVKRQSQPPAETQEGGSEGITRAQFLNAMKVTGLVLGVASAGGFAFHEWSRNQVHIEGEVENNVFHIKKNIAIPTSDLLSTGNHISQSLLNGDNTDTMQIDDRTFHFAIESGLEEVNVNVDVLALVATLTQIYKTDLQKELQGNHYGHHQIVFCTDATLNRLTSTFAQSFTSPAGVTWQPGFGDQYGSTYESDLQIHLANSSTVSLVSVNRDLSSVLPASFNSNQRAIVKAVDTLSALANEVINSVDLYTTEHIQKHYGASAADIVNGSFSEEMYGHFLSSIIIETAKPFILADGSLTFAYTDMIKQQIVMAIQNLPIDQAYIDRLRQALVVGGISEADFISQYGYNSNYTYFDEGVFNTIYPMVQNIIRSTRGFPITVSS